MLTIPPVHTILEACECGRPAMPDVVVIQHCVNEETGATATHGPDRVCEECVVVCEDDAALGVIVLHLPAETFELIRLS
jgi:hypothetical protein